MSEAVQTLDGWYCLHDFRKIDWTSWKQLSEAERNEAVQEFEHMLNNWHVVEKEKKVAMLFTQLSDKRRI